MDNYDQNLQIGYVASTRANPINLKLIFSDEVASPVFTKENIIGKSGGDGGNDRSIKVILVNSHTQEKITTGPVASTKVKIVLLRENCVHEDGDVSSSVKFEKNIVVDWRRKKNILLGDMYVDLKHGCGTVGAIRIKHDRHPLSNVRFRLGAMVVDCRYEVKEAITDPFEVKDLRNKPKLLGPLLLEDKVWQLMNISRNGMIHKRLESKNIRILKDFLDMYFSNPRELQEICRIKGKNWEMTVNHAKTSLTENMDNAKSRVGSTSQQSNGSMEFDDNCYKPQPFEKDNFNNMMIMDCDFSTQDIELSDMYLRGFEPYCQAYDVVNATSASFGRCGEGECVKAKKIWMKLSTIWFSIAYMMKKDMVRVGVRP